MGGLDLNLEQVKTSKNLEDIKVKLNSYMNTGENGIKGNSRKDLNKLLEKVSPSRHSSVITDIVGKEIKDQLQPYFENAESRQYDMVNFLDCYGRKFRYMNIDNTDLSYD